MDSQLDYLEVTMIDDQYLLSFSGGIYSASSDKFMHWYEKITTEFNKKIVQSNLSYEERRMVGIYHSDLTSIWDVALENGTLQEPFEDLSSLEEPLAELKEQKRQNAIKLGLDW